MAADLRQVMAAFLTFSMFIMLGNMIKKDHIDPLLELPEAGSPNISYNSLKISKPGRLLKDVERNEVLWTGSNETLKPCWEIQEKQQSNNGYIFFSLTHGPEYHASQVANAVAVARQLGAKIAIPDIRGTKVGDKIRQFEEIYDVDNFVASLHGLVQVDKNPPAEISKGRLTTLRVPYRPPMDYISSMIEPVFRIKRNVKLITYYTNSNRKEDESSNVYECVATFESLKLNSELQRVVDSMEATLRSMSEKTHGRFVAVDLKEGKLKKRCRSCYDAEEIAEFLKNVGFLNDTSLYLTHARWSTDLDGLRNQFPNTFTKDAIMGVDHKAKYMGSGNEEYEKIIDFYTCVKGDVFIPAMGSRFYSGVVGQRIAEGKTRVFLPAKNASIEATSDYVAPLIANKTHFAYSCFC
ncbi:hypothetical protein ACS0TY_016745 [Phlomoides rotata]